MELVQILDEVFYVGLCVNALGKDMNLTVIPPTMDESEVRLNYHPLVR